MIYIKNNQPPIKDPQEINLRSKAADKPTIKITSDNFYNYILEETKNNIDDVNWFGKLKLRVGSQMILLESDNLDIITNKFTANDFNFENVLAIVQTNDDIITIYLKQINNQPVNAEYLNGQLHNLLDPTTIKPLFMSDHIQTKLN